MANLNFLSLSTPEMTYNSFSILVQGIKVGDRVKFWLAYADNQGKPTTTIAEPSTGDEKDPYDITFKSAGGHHFVVNDINSSSRLAYTIACIRDGQISEEASQKAAWTTEPPPPEKERPDDWEWGSGLVKGQPVSKCITYTSWNSFTARINEFRDYKRLSKLNITTVQAGDKMSIRFFNNQAASAIAEMGASPPTVSANEKITTGYFIALRDALNSIK